MKTSTRTWLSWSASLVVAVSLAGCEYNDDPTDHDVPPGKAVLVVDNNSIDDLAVYVDGVRKENADAFEDRAYTMEPGLHRVVLDQRGGSRSFAGDVDLLRDRRTIMNVTVRDFDSQYDVRIYFD